MPGPRRTLAELFALERWSAEDVEEIFKLWRRTGRRLSSFAREQGWILDGCIGGAKNISVRQPPFVIGRIRG